MWLERARSRTSRETRGRHRSDRGARRRVAGSAARRSSEAARDAQPEAIGQRAATNLAAQHQHGALRDEARRALLVDEGFDVKLIAADEELGRPDVTQIPAQYNLHAFNWRCRACGRETYQGPTPACVCGPDANEIGQGAAAVRRVRRLRSRRGLGAAAPAGARQRVGRPRVAGADRVLALRSRAALPVLGQLPRSAGRRRASSSTSCRASARASSCGAIGSSSSAASTRRTGLGPVRHGDRLQVLAERRPPHRQQAHVVRAPVPHAGRRLRLPVPESERAVERARAHSRRLWIDGTWPGATRPLSWLLEKFAPVPDWTCSGRSSRRSKRSTADVVFFCEHDVLYHPSHFTFTPPRRRHVLFQPATWRVDARPVRRCSTTAIKSPASARSRALLLEHYRRRVAHVEAHGFDRAIGFEPSGNARSRALFGDVPVATWMSPAPNVDIKTKYCLTPGRWSQDQFRNKEHVSGLADEVPGWGSYEGTRR
jgi:hypothetical protein